MVIITKEFSTTVSTDNDNRTTALVEGTGSGNQRTKVWDPDYVKQTPLSPSLGTQRTTDVGIILLKL